MLPLLFKLDQHIIDSDLSERERVLLARAKAAIKSAAKRHKVQDPNPDADDPLVMYEPEAEVSYRVKLKQFEVGDK